MPRVVAKRYVQRRGYANYWYNEQAQEQLWRRYVEGAAVDNMGYEWTLVGALETGGAFRLDMNGEAAELQLPTGNFKALFSGDLSGQLSPPRSGGLLVTLHAWQRLLDKGLRRFGEVYYLGRMPHGPDNRVEDCLVGFFEGMETRFFFAEKTGDLTGIELFAADDADPCEIWFADYAEFSGRRLPKRWLIRHGEADFAELVVERWDLKSAARAGDGGED
jgi:hypothetical protein